MIAHAVTLLGRRSDRIHVADLRTLKRLPFHGITGALAWRFDGARITLVHVMHPNMSDLRPRKLVARSA